MIEPLAALAFTVFGVILGGGVLFALWFDRVPLETHQAVIESGKAHREYRDEIIRALGDDVASLKAQLAKVHRKRDPKTGRWAK